VTARTASIRPYRQHGGNIICDTRPLRGDPSSSQEVQQQLSEDKESSKKGWSERIGELGPAWITAIAALCAVFVGGGYAVGQAQDSEARASAPQPTVTVTVTAPATAAVRAATATATATSPVASSPQSPHASHIATTNGSMLGTYEVDLPSGYSIPLGASKPTQSQFDSSEQNGDLDDTWAPSYDELGSDKMVQLPNGTTPTYQGCINSTAFTNGISGGSLGVAFCILENGKIAGVEVVSQSSTSSDYILQVTVWRNVS
jgi:hypothetical protein